MCCQCNASPEDSNPDDRDFQIGMYDAIEENRQYAKGPEFSYFDLATFLARHEFREFTPEMFIDDDEGIAA